jgi:eukaryotic-like serine/threonine-protein kinase
MASRGDHLPALADETTSTVALDVTPAAPGAEGPVTIDRTAVVDVLLVESDEQERPLPARDRYRLEREIAHGAMGRVLLAQDQDINRPVAVKVMRAGRSTSPRARRRFVEEVQLAGQLAHPNIVPIHDVGLTEDGVGWYTMRYVDGSTLSDVIQRLQAGDPLAHALYTPARRLQLFLSVLDAIAYAHARGVIHRDLKPANILVGKYGEIFVADWGIAKRIGRGAKPEVDTVDESTLDDSKVTGSVDTDTRDGAIIGTPWYMSPEQARGDNTNVDQRSDVYALAAILYELLCLRHYLHPLPKDAKTEDVLRAVQEHTATLATGVSHPAQPMRVPMDIARMIVRGLAKDPRVRFQSVAEMRAAILKIVDGTPAVQCPSTAFLWGLGLLKRAMSRAPILGWFFVASVFGSAVWGVVDLARMALGR